MVYGEEQDVQGQRASLVMALNERSDQVRTDVRRNVGPESSTSAAMAEQWCPKQHVEPS